jgi:periplasmic protein TonB
MKRILSFFLLTLSLSAKSQDSDYVYIFDAHWKPTSLKSAKFLLNRYQINDTCWQWDFYNFMGPLLKSEQYRNKEGSELNGVSRYFNEKGINDSATTFYKGKRNGDSWTLNEDSVKLETKYVYRDDSLIEVVDLSKWKKDTSLGKGEIESEYPGGIAAWYRYLSKNLRYPDRAVTAEKQGNVIVGFVIDIYGNAIDPYIARSVEYSLDKEAIRIVKGSGSWLAASQNGQNVKSYKVQPINFRLEVK